MAKFNLPDDDKVMDVARPGKGKIVGTSRPVIPLTNGAGHAPHITRAPESPPTETVRTLSQVPDESSSPSAARLTIQPLTPPQEQANTDQPEESLSQNDDQKEASKPQETTELQSAKDTQLQDQTNDEVSDAASVNALAESMMSKKEDAKKAEEKAQKEVELQELVKNKKYFVSISHDSGKSSRSIRVFLLVALLVIFAGLVSAYLLIDAKVIKTNISLPYEFFKDAQLDTTPNSTPISQAKEKTNAVPAETKIEQTIPLGFSEFKQEELKFRFAYPSAWGTFDAREKNGVYPDSSFIITIGDDKKDDDIISVDLRGESESTTHENTDSMHSKGFIKKGSVYYHKTSANDGVEIAKENVLGSYETDFGEVIVVRNVFGIGNGPNLKIYVNFEQSQPIDGLVLTFSHSNKELSEGKDQFNAADIEQLKQVAQTFKKF